MDEEKETKSKKGVIVEGKIDTTEKFGITHIEKGMKRQTGMLAGKQFKIYGWKSFLPFQNHWHTKWSNNLSILVPTLDGNSVRVSLDASLVDSGKNKNKNNFFFVSHYFFF